MNVLVRREKIIHDDKVNLAAARKFDSMKTIKSRDEGVRVGGYMVVVTMQSSARREIE